MTISKITNEEQFNEMRWEDDDFTTLISSEITDTGRWVEYHYVIWSEQHDGVTHFFGASFEVPATEQQEGSEAPFDVSDIHEVFPREITTTKYFTQRELDKINLI